VVMIYWKKVSQLQPPQPLQPLSQVQQQSMILLYMVVVLLHITQIIFRFISLWHYV